MPVLAAVLSSIDIFAIWGYYFGSYRFKQSCENFNRFGFGYCYYASFISFSRKNNCGIIIWIELFSHYKITKGEFSEQLIMLFSLISNFTHILRIRSDRALRLSKRG